MVNRVTSAYLPQQLRDIWAQAQYLPDAVRGALTVTLFSAADNATPEKVLSDTFARLGYLPDEAKQAALRLLPQRSLNLRQELPEVKAVKTGSSPVPAGELL